ncbi:MAG: hypothetical protein MUP63_03855 [Candidatus Nanohaloarchaeota archaeon QJJ-7]|nr:hypothetical protein [Candidatus Nanohaloarchaeota archaeon QJJ-7]
METVDAEDALEYVTSRDVLYLIWVILLGGVLIWTGTVMTDSHTPIIALPGYLGILGGMAVEVGGTLALFYKLIADATA